MGVSRSNSLHFGYSEIRRFQRPVDRTSAESKMFPTETKIVKLVNNISINPSKKNIDLTEMWSRYTRRGVTFQDQSWVHLDPWVAGRNQGKAVDFDGSVGKT